MILELHAILAVSQKPCSLQRARMTLFEMVDQKVGTLQVICSSGNGFIIESLQHLDINFNVYKPIKRSSYIPTPASYRCNHFLLKKQKKPVHMCLAYSILAALKPSDSHKK